MYALARALFYVWAGVAVLLAARWMLGFKFSMTGIRFGNYLSVVLGFVWCGSWFFIETARYVLQFKVRIGVDDFWLKLFLLPSVPASVVVLTIVAIYFYTTTTIQGAARRSTASAQDSAGSVEGDTK